MVSEPARQDISHVHALLVCSEVSLVLVLLVGADPIRFGDDVYSQKLVVEGVGGLRSRAWCGWVGWLAGRPHDVVCFLRLAVRSAETSGKSARGRPSSSLSFFCPILPVFFSFLFAESDLLVGVHTHAKHETSFARADGG